MVEISLKGLLELKYILFYKMFTCIFVSISVCSAGKKKKLYRFSSKYATKI